MTCDFKPWRKIPLLIKILVGVIAFVFALRSGDACV
jgi:hypothetical protein